MQQFHIVFLFLMVIIVFLNFLPRKTYFSLAISGLLALALYVFALMTGYSYVPLVLAFVSLAILNASFIDRNLILNFCVLALFQLYILWSITLADSLYTDTLLLAAFQITAGVVFIIWYSLFNSGKNFFYKIPFFLSLTTSWFSGALIFQYSTTYVVFSSAVASVFITTLFLPGLFYRIFLYLAHSLSGPINKHTVIQDRLNYVLPVLLLSAAFILQILSLIFSPKYWNYYFASVPLFLYAIIKLAFYGANNMILPSKLFGIYNIKIILNLFFIKMRAIMFVTAAFIFFVLISGETGYSFILGCTISAALYLVFKNNLAVFFIILIFFSLSIWSVYHYRLFPKLNSRIEAKSSGTSAEELQRIYSKMAYTYRGTEIPLADYLGVGPERNLLRMLLIGENRVLHTDYAFLYLSYFCGLLGTFCCLAAILQFFIFGLSFNTETHAEVFAFTIFLFLFLTQILNIGSVTITSFPIVGLPGFISYSSNFMFLFCFFTGLKCRIKLRT